jgi:type II secretory ATPase GspE/PulE/Tfp pilus assembly ATPase PilB-like protein
MQRWLAIYFLGTVVGAVVLSRSTAWAQADAATDSQSQAAADQAAAQPPPSLDRWNDAHSIPRFDRPSISWLKLASIWLLFLIWVKSADWVNRDTQIIELSYGLWNSVLFFPFAALLLFTAFPFAVGLPYYIVAAILLSLCYLGTIIPYVVVRNKAVPLHERVCTPDWFRYEFAYLAGKVGLKIEAERKADYEKGPPVDLMAIAAAEERNNQANLLTARQSPGYIFTKELVAEMIGRRSDRVVLDYTQQSVVARHHVDGVWHNGEARDRESGDVMLAVIKTLSNLDMTERRKKQEGRFAAKYEGQSYICPVVSQGVKTGERVVIDLMGGPHEIFHSYEDLGMRKKLGDRWSELMALDQGLLIIAGLPEGGVTTLTDVSLMETDRLLRDFVSVEEEHHREREIENIEVTKYNEANGETLDGILPKLIRKYPNVYVVRDLVNPEAAKLLLDEVAENHLVITNVQAKDAPEALLRMLQKKVPHREFAERVTAVICTRLIRKLCESCKVAYEPTPDLLKKLGIPAGKVEALYRVPKPEEMDKPCKACGGVGFFGRTGIFELLVVDENIREILLKQPKLEVLRPAARAANMRPFQEEGVLLIAKGVTSLAELQRVLKQ